MVRQAVIFEGCKTGDGACGNFNSDAGAASRGPAVQQVNSGRSAFWTDTPKPAVRSRGYENNSSVQVSAMLQDYGRVTDDNFALVKRLKEKQAELDAANQKICNLKEGFYGSDWQLRQDDVNNRIWLSDGRKHEILLEGAVKKVVAYTLQSFNELQLAFEVKIHLSSGSTETVFINLHTLETPNLLIRAFEMQGICLRVKRSNSLKGQLLKRLILGKVSETIPIPYQSGWSGQTFCFCNEKGSRKLKQLGFSVPYMQRKFSEKRFSVRDFRQGIETLFLQQGAENAVLILTVAAGGILYTPLFQKGYRPDVLFSLEGHVHYIKRIRHWLQPWENELCAGLSHKQGLEKALQDSRDEIFFLVDNGTAYELRLSQFLDGLARNGELICRNEIKQFNSIPLLLTERRGVWEKAGVPLLNLPFVICEDITTFSKSFTSAFWHSFCIHLNAGQDFWRERLEKVNASEDDGMAYLSVYNWLAAAYTVFCPFMRSIIGANIISEHDFSHFVAAWLQNVDAGKRVDIGDKFILVLQQMKKKGQIGFVSLEVFERLSIEKYVFAVDEEFVYISKGIFSALVKKFFPGYLNKDVYGSLVENGDAKGDKDHLFPKSPQKLNLGGNRERLAQIRRPLLLSDAELKLEVL